MDFSIYSGFKWLPSPVHFGVSIRDPKIFVCCYDNGVDFYDSVDDFTNKLNEFLKKYISENS